VTVARVVGVGALVLVAILAIWLILFRSTGHEYTFVFQNAGQLVRGNEVRIAGRPIGKVNAIGLTKDNRAAIKVTVEEPYAPLSKGTTAAIRAGSLSGQANKYIALSLGPDNAPKYEDNATLGTDRTTTIVDLDTLFATLEPETREGLKNVIKGSSVQYGNDGDKANESLKYFNPVVKSFADLSAEITKDQQAFADAIVNTAKVTSALAERGDDLTGLVDNTASAMGAIAEQSGALDQALRDLPAALRGGNTTLASLRAGLDDLDQLTDATRPVAPKLEPFFRELRPLVRDAEPTIKNLRLLVTRPGPGNDLTDLFNTQPRLTKISGPALNNTSESLRKSTPVLTFLRPYAPDLIGWFRDFGQTTANYDANGHFARVSPAVDAFAFDRTSPGTATFTARDPANRQNALEKGKVARCPGAAAAPPTDGSAPFKPAGLECDLSAVIPGP
jgi:phospholipid/cholesterol/gamma-HCH transport system substrate-binding protein